MRKVREKPKKAKRPRGNMLDWMELPAGEEEKAARDRVYVLIPERREVITQWARNGCTKEEIAENMGISSSSLRDWIKKCPDIGEALKEARAYAHARVENALFRKAVGFTIERQQPVKRKVAEYDGVGKKIGEHEEIEIQTISEYVPPDMGAIAFYLKNNLPNKYKDKWPDQPDDGAEIERENLCLKEFTQAVAKAVIKENESD